MKPRITLGEKLKDLRVERNLRFVAVYESIGIYSATLQRLEADEDMRIGYQYIEVLARFYGVSTDWLFGRTGNNEEH